MRSADTARLRCGAPFRLRGQLYRALSHAISTVGGPAGAVFETVMPDPVPWITVRPAGLLDVVRHRPAGTFGDVDIDPGGPAPHPPRATIDRIASIVSSEGGVPGPPTPVPPLPPTLDRLLGPQGWLGVQTFWVRGAHGGLVAGRRIRFATSEGSDGADRFGSVARAMAYDWSMLSGRPCEARPAHRWATRTWRRRSLAGLDGRAWTRLDGESLAGTAEVRWVGIRREMGSAGGHTVVLGSTGAGKTTYLARRAVEAIQRGEATAVLDLHGDLTPAIVAALDTASRTRVVAIDATERPVPGIAALPSSTADDRAAAVLVAAIKRLSAESGDLYWGFRLERIFDSFVRLAQESGGTIVDVYDLLTREERREAARLTTRRPELARFLEELGPIVRRSPDFLWSAATRLSKIALVPSLRDLLAPPDGGLPVERLLAEGRALLVRLPFRRLGPEAATLAGTLVLARLFLGLADREALDGARSRVLIVLDEVHGFSPPLVSELLGEGRKYGFRAVVATQYPERMAPELRAAAAGAATGLVAFRVPPRSAAEVGLWLGLSPPFAERIFSRLPAGHGIALDPETGRLDPIAPEGPPLASEDAPWIDARDRARREFGALDRPTPLEEQEPAVERLLLALLGAEEEGLGIGEGDSVERAGSLPGPAIDPALLWDGLRTLRSRGWVHGESGRLGLSAGGRRALGLSSPTGASRESAEHRRLLIATFRVFARRGYRIEIVRQGRFDTTLPDARFRQLGSDARARTPVDLAETIDRVRSGWAWRYFGGRDVNIEAEVTGALRPERIHRGWTKARSVGAFVLFVVGTCAHARRVRASLARWHAEPRRASVWVLPAIGHAPLISPEA
ncbi:MAG TPA: hypothetical protein VEL82_04030 [Thermoplasmata archaeon]|nr:hypothetical protein [Thermoplasmata archaeon]